MEGTVGELDRRELAHRLRETRLIIRLGPVDVRVGVSDDASIESFAHLYRHHPMRAADAVADFTFTLHRQRGGRSRLAAYGRMELDGVPLTKPFEWKYAWPMFEWGLHYAVSRRGGFALMFHSSVVTRGGKALVLPARTGSGKSTLCALLLAAGWEFVSDEFLVLERRAGALAIRCLPQPVALKGASIGLLGSRFGRSEWSEPWPHASKGTIRYLRPPPVDHDMTLQPGWIVLPRFEAGAATTIEPLSRSQAFLALGPNSFNYHWRGVDGFHDGTELVRASRCATVRFGEGDSVVQALESWIRQE